MKPLENLNVQHQETLKKNNALIKEALQKAKELGINDIARQQVIINKLITAIERDAKLSSERKGEYLSIRTVKSKEQFLYISKEILTVLNTTKNDISEVGLGEIISQKYNRESGQGEFIETKFKNFEGSFRLFGKNEILNDVIISAGYIEDVNQIAELQKDLKNKEKEINKLNSQLKEINKEQQLDPETGFKNRDAFNDHLQDSLKGLEHKRSDIKTVSLIIMKIDNFDDIQNNHEKLREVARSLKKELRSPRDIIFRFDKNEFCLIVTNQKKEGIDILAKKLSMAGKNIKAPLLVGTSGTYEQTMADCKIIDCENELFSRARQRLNAIKMNGNANNMY